MSCQRDSRRNNLISSGRTSDMNPYVGLRLPGTEPNCEDVYCNIHDDDVVLPNNYRVTITKRHCGWSRGQCAIVWTLIILLIASFAFGIYLFFNPRYSCQSEQMHNIPTVDDGCSDLGAGEIDEIPPQCCSFPFTYKGNLFYQCTPGANGHFGCFRTGRIWTACAEPHDYSIKNKTILVSIPRVVRFTATSVNGWIVFQQRLSSTALFNNTWRDYKDGFGNHDGNFWIGLEKLYQLTNINQYRLRLELLLENGTWLSAEYNNFSIGNEETKYKIRVDGYSGETGDLFNSSNIAWVHNGMPFSTTDNDNDRSDENCADSFNGGWWYNRCSLVNLHGMDKRFNSTYTVYNFHVGLQKGGNIYNYRLVTSRMLMKLA